MKNPLVWIIGGTLAVIALLKFKMASALQYSFGGLSIGNGSVINPQLIVNINVFNPTNTASNLNRITASVLSNGNLVGTIDAVYNQNIAANTTTIIQLPVNVSLGGLISDIINIISKKGSMIQIKGTVTADLISFPLDINYNL